MRILPQGIEFSRHQLIQIGFSYGGCPDHDRICGDVTQTLATAAEPADGSADEVKRRQHVDKSQEIASDDLVELKPHALCIDDSQPKQLLADRLAAPYPLKKDSVADTDHKVRDRKSRAGDVEAHQLKEQQQCR